jgi:hypothetical protein
MKDNEVMLLIGSNPRGRTGVANIPQRAERNHFETYDIFHDDFNSLFL